jgi:hypothetical protein
MNESIKEPSRKTLDQIKHNPTPKDLYESLMSSEGWPYIKEDNKLKFLPRDRALVATLYLGDFRVSEVLPLTKDNFELTTEYLWVKDVKVGKKRHNKITWREAKFPLVKERLPFTQLVLDYLDSLKPHQRLFPWSLKVTKTELKNWQYSVKGSTELRSRYSVKMIGTTRAWQIVNALLPEYTEHWLRAFGYNYDYDHMDHDIMAVSDKTKADPRSLQPYLRRRYEKYKVR